MEGYSHLDSGLEPLPQRSGSRPVKLFDARGVSLSADGPLIARSQRNLEHRSDIVIPDIHKSLPKELQEKFSKISSDTGFLYLPKEREQQGIELDLSQAPEKLRAESAPEYFDFSEEEVKIVLETHERYAKNLFSGNTQQRGIYVARLLEAAGFDAENKQKGNTAAFVRGAVEAATEEQKEAKAQAPYIARERFLAGFFSTHENVSHPSSYREEIPELNKQRANAKDASYQRLSLLFMPKIWSDLNQSERLTLLDGIVTLFEYTDNPAEIVASELFLRLTQILAQEQDVGVRSLIYLLFDVVPYAIVPQEAKNGLARVITQRQEFNAPIAIALLTDPGDKAGVKSPEIAGLRQEYLAFRRNVLDRLAQPAEELAKLPVAQWRKLVKEVEHLSLLSITDDKTEEKTLAKELFGVEFEVFPHDKSVYRGFQASKDQKPPNSLNELAAKARHALIAIGNKRGLQDAARDQGAVEVKTVGPVPVDVKAFCALRETTRVVSHLVPHEMASFHVHVEREKKNLSFEGRLFANYKHNDQGTLELRSFRPPTLRMLQQGRIEQRPSQVDIRAVESSILFGVLSKDIPLLSQNESSQPFFLTGFSPEEGVQKILSLCLFGSDPRQRAAVIQLMNRPPLFLSGKAIAGIVCAHAPIRQEEEYCKAAEQVAYKIEGGENFRDQFNHGISFIRRIQLFQHEITQAHQLYRAWSWDERSEFWKRLGGLYHDCEGRLSREDKRNFLGLVVEHEKEMSEVGFSPEMFVEDIAVFLPDIAHADATGWIEFLIKNGEHLTWEWSEEDLAKLATLYSNAREGLSPEQRLYFYRILATSRAHEPTLAAVLEKYISDADEDTRARFYLCVAPEGTGIEEFEQAINYVDREQPDWRYWSTIFGKMDMRKITEEKARLILKHLDWLDQNRLRETFSALSKAKPALIQEFLSTPPTESQRGFRDAAWYTLLNELPEYTPEWERTIGMQLEERYTNQDVGPLVVDALIQGGYYALARPQIEKMFRMNLLPVPLEDLEKRRIYTPLVRRQKSLDLLVRLATTNDNEMARSLFVEYWPQLNSEQRTAFLRSLINPKYTENGEEEYDLEKKNQALFCDLLIEEQEASVVQEAVKAAACYGSSFSDLNDWAYFIHERFPEISQEVREQLFDSLVVQERRFSGLIEEEQSIILDVVKEYFPYGASWSNNFSEEFVRRIAEYLGEGGKDFLLEIYDSRPTPLLKRAIEAAIPRTLASITTQRARDWQGREAA